MHQDPGEGAQPGDHLLLPLQLLSKGTRYRTNTGRTRTAPEPTADVTVRFAVANCQDYVGRYWNSYQQLLTQQPDQLDFFVAIGDYIYETTGSTTSQPPAATRKITFASAAEAIDLGGGELAAKMRGELPGHLSDVPERPHASTVHETWPVIVTWDDHEYSDDCHGSDATYFDGRKSEHDDTRRQNAEQVFFEFIPVDEGTPGSDPSTDVVVTDRATCTPTRSSGEASSSASTSSW
jgi:alkaline phosphatase D